MGYINFLLKQLKPAVVCIAAALCLLSGHSGAAADRQMIEPHAQAMPLLPFLDYIIDETMTMDIEEAAKSTGWRPMNNLRLPREEGVVWLRFTIAPVQPDSRPQTFLLDMGQSVPGEAALFEPVENELSGTQEWRENLPSNRNIILLPEGGPKAQVCFIRLNGLPGPWFAPMIRTPHNAATNWGSLARPAAVLALGVVMILCLLRGLSEAGQWRYWTALFVAAALAQALLGMPQALYTYTAWDLAAILLPGIALMMLPHVGRHLMQTRTESRAIDIQLFLLTLPGIALALAPLVPGWNWLERWLDLWPLGAALFIPTALGAWMTGLYGSRRFLLACLVLPLFAGVALIGLEFGIPANILASGPDWGVALAALILAAAAMPARDKGAKKDRVKSAKPPISLETEPVINLEHPLDDPNLRLIPADGQEPLNLSSPLPRLNDDLPDDSVPALVPERPEMIRESEVRELALREPVDEIMKETIALSQCALPPSARKSVESLVSASNRLANIISRPGVPPDFGKDESQETQEELFNLQKVLRNAHDAVASIAEYSGITLSWYMPPHLGPLFRGYGQPLEDLLRSLLESATRATSKGAIKLSARRVPGTQDNGYLLFTVEDEGQGYPPKNRSSLALAKAWELAGQTGGYLSVESNADGSTVSFSAHFTPVENAVEAEAVLKAYNVLLTASSREERRKLKRILESANCNVIECDSAQEAALSQEKFPAPLLIAQGTFAKPAAGDMVKEFIRLARQAGFPNPRTLAVTEDQSQWRLLKTSGFTHAMLEPVDPEVLRRTVIRLLDANLEKTENRHETEVSDLIDDQHAELNRKRDKAKSENMDEEKIPIMLIEQKFSPGGTFEGPDWLDRSEDHGHEQIPTPESNKSNSVPENHAADNEVKRGEPAESRMEAREIGASRYQAGGFDTIPVTERIAETENLLEHTADIQRPVDESMEWVGEPMPIGSPVSEAAARNMAAMGLSNRPVESRPADGQPMTHKEEDNGIDAGEENKESGSDVMSSGPHAENSMETAQQPVDSESQGGSAVRDFVNTSVNLVANTLSTMLKNTQQKSESAKVETELKPAQESQEMREERGSEEVVDPVITGLVSRLDEAMEQAKAAFAGGNNPAVATASSLAAREAEDFGLRNIARLADSLGRAARDNNAAAMSEILLELGNAIEQNRTIMVRKKEIGQL